jgi:hypothetical protein
LEAVADLIFAVSPNDEAVDDADLLTVLFAFGQGCERAIHPCSERIHLWGTLMEMKWLTAGVVLLLGVVVVVVIALSAASSPSRRRQEVFDGDTVVDGFGTSRDSRKAPEPESDAGEVGAGKDGFSGGDSATRAAQTVVGMAAGVGAAISGAVDCRTAPTACPPRR